MGADVEVVMKAEEEEVVVVVKVKVKGALLHAEVKVVVGVVKIVSVGSFGFA